MSLTLKIIISFIKSKQKLFLKLSQNQNYFCNILNRCKSSQDFVNPLSYRNRIILALSNQWISEKCYLNDNSRIDERYERIFTTSYNLSEFSENNFWKRNSKLSYPKNPLRWIILQNILNSEIQKHFHGSRIV